MAKPFELVVISGKGGTGKTSVAVSIAALAGRSTIADCDVDAPDMHIILSPVKRKTERFIAGNLASVKPEWCIACGACLANCRFDAVKEGDTFSIDESACEGCGVCVMLCPCKAISFEPRNCGELLESETRFGPMAHALLKPGGENSGKLVSAVKERAKALAESESLSLTVIDGPPGIGCPVIASVSGASMALLVAEPTASAMHDLLRALELLKHFGVPAAVCVNRWDINPEMTEAIELAASKGGASIAGRIRYDKGFSKAQAESKALVETESAAAEDIRAVWRRLVEGNQALYDAVNASKTGKGV